MYDKLVLQDVGLQALVNASAGGILVSPVSFKAGDSGSSPDLETGTGLLGNVVVQGNLHHVEVTSRSVARFFFDLDGKQVNEEKYIREVCIFLDGGIILGRCVFKDPIKLQPGEITQVSVGLYTARADLSVLNVAFGDYESTPVTPFLYRLPSPDATQFSNIVVANGMENADGSDSPCFAVRFGGGPFQWSFTGHTRVFANKPDSSNATSFKVSTDQTFADKESVIVHVVSGAHQGQTRRFYYSAATDSFIESDGVPLIGGVTDSTIAIWKATGAGVSAVSNIPSRDGVPDDWVLSRGPGDKPVWAPQKSGAKVLNTLYTPPSRLNINVLNYLGDGEGNRFSIGTHIVENENYVYPALGGISQHRSAFSVSGSELEFAEPIPQAVPVDLRLFTKESSTGTRLEFSVKHFTTDGSQVSFELDYDIGELKYAFVFLHGALQAVTAYTYDAASKSIVFVEAPQAGLSLEIRYFRHVADTGYSTRIVSRTYITTGETLFFELPIQPQSQEQVFLTYQGTHIHDDLYSIVESTLVLSGAVSGGMEIEILVFDNVLAQGSENTNLKGIVYDAYTTYKSLKLLRHGAEPIMLPIPSPNFQAGPGIRIAGNYPNLRIESTLGNSVESYPVRRYSNLQSEKDANQVITTYRVDLRSNSILLVTCDFSAKLGPGFSSPEGMEFMEFVVGMRSTNTREPDFGKQTIGTGHAGFSSLPAEKTEVAYGNASLTRIFHIDMDNHPAKFVEVVAKMRVNNANISQFGSRLSININVVEIPLWSL